MPVNLKDYENKEENQVQGMNGKIKDNKRGRYSEAYKRKYEEKK